jgi:LPPG:FO 2-phospho-L-lactate transferase
MMRRRIVGVISGGSGSSKFAIALDRYADQEKIDFAYVCNVADNFWFHGLYVCPDIDIITYALGGILDEKKGWGISGDSRNFLKTLEMLGYESWFNLGDRDLAISVARTEQMKSGFSLSETTEKLRKSLGIKNRIVPATDSQVQTYMDTNLGRIHLQDFWVRNKGIPKVYDVHYVGIETAKPTSETLELLSQEVIILPANPITSILPTLSLRRVRKKLKDAKVIAISPFVGKNIFSGPAAKLMKAMNIEPSTYGVAKLYSDILDLFIVDRMEDSSEVKKIKELGIECIKTNVRANTPSEKQHISNEIMRIL